MKKSENFVLLAVVAKVAAIVVFNPALPHPPPPSPTLVANAFELGAAPAVPREVLLDGWGTEISGEPAAVGCVSVGRIHQLALKGGKRGKGNDGNDWMTHLTCEQGGTKVVSSFLKSAPHHRWRYYFRRDAYDSPTPYALLVFHRGNGRVKSGIWQDRHHQRRWGRY